MPNRSGRKCEKDRFARERIEHAIEVVRIAHSSHDRRHREGGRRGLDRPQEQVGERRAVRVEDERDPRDLRRGLLERLQPFGSYRELEAGKAGEIAARMRQVQHEALADRVGHLSEYDWQDLALLPQRGRHRSAVGQDQVGRHGEQLRRVVAQFIFSAAGPAVLDPEVAPLDPSQLPQAVFERVHARLCLWVAGDKTHQHADPPHPLALLRAHCEWPGDRRPAEQRDELAASNESRHLSLQPDCLMPPSKKDGKPPGGRPSRGPVITVRNGLIELNGDDLRRDPLQVRKATLVSTLAKAGLGIRFNEHLECDDGETVFRHACGWAWKASCRSVRTTARVAHPIGSR
jgi:hypothetical protein